MTEPVSPFPFPIRSACPPGACVCEYDRVVADPQADHRPLALNRLQEQKLIERIERIESYEDLKHVQAVIHRNLGVALRIEPGPNEVRTVRGIIVVLEEKPGLCKKARQSIPAAVRRCLNERPEIAYALLDAHDLFGAP
ncbi:hypothetical protein [Massilia yuzhufengensis]|uniref:Ribosomal protein S3AE n=1 Tax=Massilia yuzhufengensis TaxID=1164594 RepID=A0A1I1WU37_9BURK|nr:hypothetical protein [Massilia yuzhufengensis]SFD98616.1 hypothetical protein SAMN05216204_15316 [Massilia yuzhufengensis]